MESEYPDKILYAITKELTSSLVADEVLNSILVNNAINYTPQGVVTIRVKEGDNIQVEVIDTGIGIPPEDLPKVFDDFFRASNVETKGQAWGCP